MDIYSKIKEVLKEMGNEIAPTLIVAKVISCSGYKCTVKIDNLQLSDVRLRAVINSKDDKVLITPSAGSYVLLHDLSGGKMRDLVVMSCSEVEKVEIQTEDTTIAVDRNGVKINGGNLGGLIKIEALTNKLNALVNAFNSHTHTVTGTAGEIPVTGTAASPAPQAASFNKTEYEDTKVKH